MRVSESQMKENVKMRSELEVLEERVEQIAIQGECFQKDAIIKLLVSCLGTGRL